LNYGPTKEYVEEEGKNQFALFLIKIERKVKREAGKFQEHSDAARCFKIFLPPEGKNL
jgi:hypothetical protein